MILHLVFYVFIKQMFMAAQLTVTIQMEDLHLDIQERGVPRAPHKVGALD